eukprot:9820713-Lingulodinium_polyedra.AAC.1
MLEHSHGCHSGPSLSSPGFNCNGKGEGVRESPHPGPVLLVAAPQNGRSAGNIHPIHLMGAPVKGNHDARPFDWCDR